MEKKHFTYNRRFITLMWFLVLSIPVIWFVQELLEFLRNPFYWIVNSLIMCGWIYVLWIIIEKLPGTSRTGSYWKEDGVTIIEYGENKVYLSGVTEICLCKSPIPRRVILQIRNNGENIKFISERLAEKFNMEDTGFYFLYAQALAENPHLVQEKDIWGEPIEYWYKADKGER